MIPMRQMKSKTLVAVPIRASQGGAVLVVSLLLLLVMTILALSVSQSTRMQERMAGNVRDSDLAFQSAEAGIRAAEDYLWTLTSEPATCSTLSSSCFIFQPSANNLPLPFDMTTYGWTTSSSNSVEFGVTGTQEILGVASDPRYVIEEFARVPETPELGRPPQTKIFYRITATGSGGTSTAQALLQSTFTKPL